MKNLSMIESRLCLWQGEEGWEKGLNVFVVLDVSGLCLWFWI